MTTLEKIKEIIRLLDLRYFNSTSTLRTSLGFIKTLFGASKDTVSIRRGGLESIFNYLPINERLVTSGQPSAAHFPLIGEAGFKTVINLAPHGAENAIANEADLVAQAGMQYLHIPVAFDNPTEADFMRFCDALRAAPEQKVFVHCAANMRVSAFVYRYRTQVLKEQSLKAQLDLHKMWKPFGVWADFVDRA